MTPCPICSQIKDVETSLAKYLAPQYDQPLPEAAARLVTLPVGAAGQHSTLRCPCCGTLYHRLVSHEYMINGTEDEVELRRLDPATAAIFFREQAALLEEQRWEIDFREETAGGLGDDIDRGQPSDTEEREAFAAMEEQRQIAAAQRRLLRELVEALRHSCPEIVATWANAHARVCRSFLVSLPDASEDDKTARFVAQSSLEAWERFPAGGETFIAVDTPWLDGYLERLERELAAAHGEI